MKRLFRSPQRTWTALVFLSAAAFFTVHSALSFQRQELLDELTSAELSHAAYALAQGDDMAVIDWGKSLEKKHNVLAFRLSDGSKMIAEGGNRNFLLKEQGPGPFSVSSLEMAVNKNIKIEVAYGPSPTRSHPALWGFLSALICLAAGLVARVGFAEGRGTTSSHADATGPVSSDPALPTSLSSTDIPLLDEAGTALFVDKNYVVRRASAKAARILGMKTGDLSQVHLLDLEPSALLMSAIERKEEVKLAGAFPSFPAVAVLLRADPNGTFLFLERNEDVPKAQNR